MISAIPTARTPIEGETSLNGTSIEADGTVITVRLYDENGDLEETYTTTVTNNSWSIPGLDDPLEFGQYITVEANAPDKDPSGESDPIFVRSVGQVVDSCTSPPTTAVRAGNRFEMSVPNLPSGLTITDLRNDLIVRLYNADGTPYASTLDTNVDYLDESVEPNPSINGYKFDLRASGPGSGNFFNVTGLRVTVQYQDQCESQDVPSGAEGTFILDAPTIIPASIDAEDTSVAGTSPPNVTITVFVIGENVGTTTSDGDGNWVLTGLPSSTFSDGDEVNAQATQPSNTNALPSALSNTVVVGTEQSLSPSIDGGYVTGDTIINGSSVEGGSVDIQVFINGIFAGNSTTDAFGNWEFELETGSLSAGDEITATALAPGKSRSDVSEAVEVLATPTDPPTIDGRIFTGGEENSITVTGGSGTVTLYIDGEAVAAKTGSGNVVFEAGVDFDIRDLYRGAVVTATNKDGEFSGESEESEGVTVESVETFLIEYVDAEGNLLNEGNVPTQTPNEPFFIRITALDGAGDTFTNFNGTATLNLGFDATEESLVTANFVEGVLAAHQIIALGGANNVIINAVSQDDPTVTGNSNEFDILGESPFDVTLSLGSCWRALSSPIQNGTFADLLGNIWTQGAEGSSYQPGDPNIFTWSLIAPDGSSEWENINEHWQPVTDLNQEIPAGTGFLVSVFADNNFDGEDDEDPVTISVSGFERLADVSPELNENSDGWTLVGNPYTDAIDFNLLGRVDLTDVAYVYDRSAGGDNAGAWLPYSAGNGGDLEDGLIAPFQGFFIQNDGDDASLTFTGSARSPEEATFYGKEKSREFVRLQLDGEGLKNSAWINFSDNGNKALIRGDALQLTPFSQDYALLATDKDGVMLDIGIFPAIDDGVEIPMMVETTRPGSYTISATDFHIQSHSSNLVFVDLHENVTIPFNESFSYTFQVNSVKKLNANVLSCSEEPEIVAKKFYPQKAVSSTERFVIRSANKDFSDLPTAFSLYQNYPNPFNPTTTIRYEIPVQSDVQLSVYDLTGRRVAILVNGVVQAGSYSVQLDGSQLASGVYMYRLTAGSQVISKKLTLIK